MSLAIGANNFELKPSLLSMVQMNYFFGSPTNNPNLHLPTFFPNYDTIKMNGVDSNVIHMRLLPFSKRDIAKSWIQSLPSFQLRHVMS